MRISTVVIIIAIIQIFVFLEQQEGQIHSSPSTTTSKSKTQESSLRTSITDIGTSILSEEDALQEVKALIDFHSILVFSKSYCPYCKSTKHILDQFQVPYTVLEVNEMKDGKVLHQAVSLYSKQTTVPNIYIDGKHIGGDSDLKLLLKSGELESMISTLFFTKGE